MICSFYLDFTLHKSADYQILCQIPSDSPASNILFDHYCNTILVVFIAEAQYAQYDVLAREVS